MSNLTVPSGWNTGHISDIAFVNPSISVAALDDQDCVSFLAMADVGESGRILNHQIRKLHEVRIGFTRFEEGDVLFAKITPCMENGKGAFARNLLNNHGFGSTEFHVLRANDRGEAEFIYHLAQSTEVRTKATAFFTGSAGQQRVDAQFFHRFPLLIPPNSEQGKIARILTTVDNLIEKTESLIAKYQAIKQGMMHDLFTRGVDAHGHLRPPQTEAPDLYKQSELGWIPKDWDVVSLNRINNRIKRGPSLSTNLQGKGIRYLTSDNIIADGRLDWTVRKHLDVAPSSLSSILEVGDVLINCVNSEEQIGKTGYVDALPENTTIGFNSFAISFQQNLIVPRFGYYQISVSRFQLMLRKMVKPAINQASFSSTDIVDMPFAKPSLHEQAQILSRLDAITSLIVAEQSPLQNLRQLKNGLMQDLLTGKVRVKVDDSEEVAR